MVMFPDEGPRDDRPAGARSLDDRLAQQVGERLCADPELRRQHLRVEVQNGVVLLSGTVDSPTGAESAVRLARTTDGVRDVCNALHLPRPRTAEASAPRRDGRLPQVAEPRGGNETSFEAIAAKLMADHPSLGSRLSMPQSRAVWTSLAVIAAIAWGLISVLLVVLLA